MASSDTSPESPKTQPAGMDDALPTLTTSLSPSQVIDQLTRASRRGRLPEYEVVEKPSGSRPGAFRLIAWGAPYDREMIGRIAGRAGEGGSTITFRTRLLMKIPIIMIVILAITVWPGVWLTDRMCDIYFDSYPWFGWSRWTWWIIYEVSVLISLPAVWMQFRKSNRAAMIEAAALAAKLEKELAKAAIATQNDNQ